MSNQKILAFSGRKQSGKNTSFHFLLGAEMVNSQLVRNGFRVEEDGRLFITDLWGDDAFEGIFDPYRRNDSVSNFLGEFIYPYIKNYSFADLLKEEVCINLLGLSYEQCYGTDDQKNSLTHLNWKDMPVPMKNIQDRKARIVEDKKMTGREVMQYVGTEIFRSMYPKVWSESTIKRIQKEGSQLAVITDCRFPSEVEAVQAAGGKVIRLTRKVDDSEHESETALDKENYDWTNFDAVIDNESMTIQEQCFEISNVLQDWDWIEKSKTDNESE